VSIEISGGGDIAVTTEALLEDRDVLMRLAVDAELVRRALWRAEADVSAAASGPDPSSLLARAGRELDELADGARRLRTELEAAAEAYGLAERTAMAVQQLSSRLLGPGVAFDRLVGILLGDALKRGGDRFADPELVGALRSLADSFDLALLVAGLQALPGAEFEETPVAVHAAGSGTPGSARAPQGFADLARRIPPADAGQPQVRVERYELPDGELHWIVYVAGTVEWSPLPSDEPWDLTSDVVGVSGGSAGSSRAALLALQSAGWQPGQPVIPVGHSQGGMVATAIATSGLAPAPLLVTFGSPTAGVPVPGGVLDVAVEHTDDPVPALGGSPQPLLDPRLLVREAAPSSPDGEGPHAMSGYRQTAAEMDSSSDARLVAARSTLAGFTGGQHAKVTLWNGERVSAVPSGG
jgi:hypothetical protein